MKIEDLLFSLIYSEICDRDLSEKVKKILTPEQIKKMYTLSKRHDMAHVVASILSKTGLACNDAISQMLQNELMEAIYYDSQREYALQEIISVLESSKIACIPLKGVVVCQYYPQTWMRTSCDIDILVHEEDADNAVKSLCKAGFVCDTNHSIHDYSLVSPNGIHLELHYTIQQTMLSKSNIILENVWEYTHLKHGSLYCYEMEEEMFLFYHLSHMGKHLFNGGCGIRSFIDLWLLEKKMPYDKEKLKSMLTEAGLLEFWNISCALSKEWMEGIPHTQKTQLLAEYVLEGGTYGTIKNSAQVHSGNGGSKWEYFMQLAFLPRENLEVVYPSLKKHPYLFPVYYIRRCFRIFRKSKRKMIASMISTRNQVTDAETEISRKMLEQLGLKE